MEMKYVFVTLSNGGIQLEWEYPGRLSVCLNEEKCIKFLSGGGLYNKLPIRIKHDFLFSLKG